MGQLEGSWASTLSKAILQLLKKAILPRVWTPDLAEHQGNSCSRPQDLRLHQMKFEAAPFNYESVLKTQMTQVCRYQEPLLALASGLAAGKGADAGALSQ